MEKWLDCTISPGQFTGEFAVQGKLANDSGFSLFAQEEDLNFDEKPTPEKSVKGGIRIETLDEKDDLVLVVLPQTTLENGQAITVKAVHIKENPK